MALLTDKVAIVTGSARGIGQAIVETFANNEAKVIVNYAHNKEVAEETVRKIRQGGGEALAVQADVSKLEDLQKLFQVTIEHFGKLDIVVNNAGIMTNGPIAGISEEMFDREFAINVKSTYFACQLAANLLQPKGRIINFSTSVLGGMSVGYSLYAATKGAVEQITRQLAKELSPKHITINAIAPGPVRTELFTNGKNNEQIENIERTIGFGRLGEPEDIARVALFLASEEAGWITGQVLRANGGFN
ncbi:MAG TPA: glucose 1-dehydrogenase [Chloroflexia bacterium]|nr:glucose 1-dehydrogenase [Chloroflexia bacterium]